MLYAGRWFVRMLFCADMVPTVLSAVAVPFTDVLLSVMYHGPRFWVKALALMNMNSMSVTEETFQEEMPMSLKEVARENM